MANELNIKELVKKVDKMKLSEIHKRLEEIHGTLKGNGNEAIDEIIPLLEETKLLKEKAKSMIGNIDSYLSAEQD